MHRQHNRSLLLLSAGVTTGAIAAGLLAHKLWISKQYGELQATSDVLSSWIQLLLQQSSPATPVAAVPIQHGQQSQAAPVVYDYAQSHEELLIEAPLPQHVTRQQVVVKISAAHLTLVVGPQQVIDGRLAGRVVPQHCSWAIEGQGSSRKLSITLCKARTPSAAEAAAAAGAAAASDNPKQQQQQQQQQHCGFEIWPSLLLAESTAGAAGRPSLHHDASDVRDQATNNGSSSSGS